MGKRRFPAEWEKQRGILLCFPHNGKDWPGKFGAIKWAFVEYIKKVSTFETVFLVVTDETYRQKVSDMLEIASVGCHDSVERVHLVDHEIVFDL